MPNWVDHDLTITGPDAELKRFMEECFGEGENGLYLDFDKLLPMPARIEKSIEQPSVQAGKSCKGDIYGLGSSERFFPDWYVWSVRHWGTKWNACHTEVKREGAAIKLRFDTAWSIPWPIYEELADFFPQLTIEGEIFEPMMEFGGHIRCHGGKIDYEDKSNEIQAQMAAFYAKLDAERKKEAHDAAHIRYLEEMDNLRAEGGQRLP